MTKPNRTPAGGLSLEFFRDCGRRGGKIGGRLGNKTPRTHCAKCGGFKSKDKPCRRCAGK